MFETVFSYFEYIDEKFSTYKDDSEITLINQRQITLEESSEDMRIVFALAEQTKQETQGYFDIARNGAYDPSGLVKGWAIYNAAEILRQKGCKDFYVDAGGDVEAVGKKPTGAKTGAREFGILSTRTKSSKCFPSAIAESPLQAPMSAGSISTIPKRSTNPLRISLA